MNAPIAIFAYNRANHLEKCIQNILLCKEAAQTNVFLFCDGPKKNANQKEIKAVEETREVIKKIQGFKSITVFISKINIGLHNSIVDGISKVLEMNDNVIVIEDDIIVGSHFLKFMNQGIMQFQNDKRIAGITGYSFPINESKPYFTRTGSCWGWATYKRVWDNFILNRNVLNLDLIAHDERKLFNVYGSIYENMFLQSKQGIIQSWAIEFYLYYFCQKQFFLMPGVNLISNTGFDGSGQHNKRGNFLTDNNNIGQLNEINFPMQIKEEPSIRKKMNLLYYKGFAKPTFLSSFINKIKFYF